MYLFIDESNNPSAQNSDFRISDDLLRKILDGKLQAYKFEYDGFWRLSPKEEDDQLVEHWYLLKSPPRYVSSGPTINQILKRNPNWHELVKPELGYLLVEEDHLRFISASEPGWDAELDEETADEIDCMNIGEEVVAVMIEPTPDSEEGDWCVWYEVLDLPTRIPVPEDED